MPISTIGSNSLNQTSDLTINGVTVGKGGGAVSTNTAVGVSALAVNQAGGTNNTAIGNSALDSNTTGDANTAVGDNALQANTTASNNTAVGYQALYSGTTAAFSTAVGYQAGYAATASYNTMFGAGAGSGASFTGNENTLVGYYAGNALTSGSKNTFVGPAFGNGCGGLITTGGSNTVIGGYSGNAGGIDIRTSSNNIVLSDGDGNVRLYGDNGGSWMFGTSRAFPRALVDIPTSGGNAGAPLAISRGGDGGSMVIFYSMNSTTTVIGSIGNSSNTNTTYNTSSDYRLKDDVATMTGALDKVSALKPVTWKWKSTGEDGQGFIAHELAQVIPDCVTGEKDAVDKDGNPVYQGVDTSYLVATLTKAIQELKTIVDAQAAEIAELKAKVA